jgi:hypothetical protein
MVVVSGDAQFNLHNSIDAKQKNNNVFFVSAKIFRTPYKYFCNIIIYQKKINNVKKNNHMGKRSRN